MDVKFHCNTKNNFRNEWQQVRAFLYSGYKIEPHNHEFYELNIIFNGTGTHQIENNHFSVKRGDVFVIPPMVVHSYYDTKDLEVYHILIKKKFILNNQEEALKMPGFIQFMEIECFLRQHFANSMFLHLTQRQMLMLQQELYFIDDKNFEGEEFKSLKSHAIWKILYWLSYLLSEQMQIKKTVTLSKYESGIILALEYIHQNFSERITIESLCKKVFLSRSTFLRNFSSVCGCTPGFYINNYRCKKAVDLIENSGLSKTEIAHRCGFYDLSHMEKTLKQF